MKILGNSRKYYQYEINWMNTTEGEKLMARMTDGQTPKQISLYETG